MTGFQRWLVSVGGQLSRVTRRTQKEFQELRVQLEMESRRRLKTAELDRRVHERALGQARTLLDLASFVLPRKITDECIGDAFEDLERAAQEGAHPWKLQAKALICVFWAFLFTLREVAKPAALLAALWRLLSGSLW